MDFSTLVRRELQALCKKNKIPANITNVAMIEALNALETVEGIEELLKPAESEMEHSSIESPEKNVNTQRSVPRSTYRTSTRQKPAREEDESQQSLARTRRGGTTSRRITKDVEEVVTAVCSSKKKAPLVSSKESEGDHKNGKATDEDKKAVPQTPAVAPSTLRKGTRASTRRNVNLDLIEAKEEKTKTVRRIYSTRRSERLSEKKPVESNLAKKETTQPIEMDSFSDDFSQVSENTVLSGSQLEKLSGPDTTVDSQALVSDMSSTVVEDPKDDFVSDLEVSADAISSSSPSSNVVVSDVDSQMQESKSSLAEEPVLTDLVIEEAKKLESDGSNSSNNQKLDTIKGLVNEEQQHVSITEDNSLTNLHGVQEQSEDNIADDAENNSITFDVQDLELSFAADGEEDSKDNNDGLEAVDSNGVENNLIIDEVQIQNLELNFAADGEEDSKVNNVLEVVDSNDAENNSIIESVQDLELSFAADGEDDLKENDDGLEVLDSNDAENNSIIESVQNLELSFAADGEDDLKENDDGLEVLDSNDAENNSIIESVQDLELSFAADGEDDTKENDDGLEVVDSIESIEEITPNNGVGSDKSLPAVEFSFQNEYAPVLDTTVGSNDESTADKPKTEPTHEVVSIVGYADDETDFSTDSKLDAKELVDEESEEETKADFADPLLNTKTEESMNVEHSAKSVKQCSPIKGNLSTLILADDDPLPTSSPIVKSLSPSPLKKSLSPSPLKKSLTKSPLTARRLAALVLDDKENTGTNVDLPREKKGKETTMKGKGLKDGTSLRKLKKMVREELQKLQISNKENNVSSNEEETMEEVAKTRMALQALPENQLEMEN